MVNTNNMQLSLDMRSVVFAIYDLCPHVVRTQEVKERMFNLANASPEGKETIF